MVLLSGVTMGCIMSAVQITPEVSPTPPPSASPSPVPTLTATPRATEAAADTAVVRAAVVNIRAIPGGAVVGQVEAGQEVTVLETDGDWVRIEGGWIWGGCLVGSEKGCEAR
jgi:uncharacterized protein YgiM (DUF1202 family)